MISIINNYLTDIFAYNPREMNKKIIINVAPKVIILKNIILFNKRLINVLFRF